MLLDTAWLNHYVTSRRVQTESPLKPLVWVGSSRKDLRSFPEPVQHEMGYALYVAQRGGKHRHAKSSADSAGPESLRR